MATTTERRAAFRFFTEHAGYIVGRRAECALALARAEELLHQADDLGVACVEWEDDDVPYDHGILSDEEIAEKFESGEWVGPFICNLRAADGEYLASLGGVVLGSAGLGDPYARVVAAELADERADELRQLIGDEKDSRGFSRLVLDIHTGERCPVTEAMVAAAWDAS